ncbi:MAG: ECF transporter S component [Lachnospiraceae bacterium]|nr:ECF transporter S component [Lachnospiraceae bacterium]
MKTKNLVVTAMLGAISGVLMVLEIPMFFVLPFIKLDLSELPIMIGGFVMGPVWGILVAIIKILVKLVIKGTSTAFVGELANLSAALLYMLPAAIIYKKNKTRKHAGIGMTVGTLAASVGMVILNTFVMFPFYMNLFGIDEAALIGMSSQANPLATNMLTIMLFMIFPFNIVKYGIVSILTMLVYKRISGLIKNFDEKHAKNEKPVLEKQPVKSFEET